MADHAVNAQIVYLERENILNKHEILGQIDIIAVEMQDLSAQLFRRLYRINALEVHQNDVFVHLCALDLDRGLFVQIQCIKIAQNLRRVAPALHLQIAANAVRADDLTGLQKLFRHVFLSLQVIGRLAAPLIFLIISSFRALENSFFCRCKKRPQRANIAVPSPAPGGFFCYFLIFLCM